MAKATLVLVAALLASLAATLAGCGGQAEKENGDARERDPHAQELPAFEVAFVSDGDVAGIESGEVTIDVARADELSAKILEGVATEAIREVGPGTETNYRAAIFTFRDAKTYKEADAFGAYVADQEADDAVNEQFRREGAEIDFFPGKVPKGGVVEVLT